MRPFHFHTMDGSALPLALKLKAEGHPVSMSPTPVGKGLISYATTPPKGAIVIFDSCAHDDEGMRYRKAGHKVIGGNQAEDMETDRIKGAQVMRDGGIRVPPTFPFKNVPDAVRFLEGSKGAWFVKINGADTGCASTCDAEDPEEMIRYLQWVQSKGTVSPFELQQKVEGVEISCNGWFDGETFLRPFDLTIEEKHFLAGGLGPRTGCESNVVWHAEGEALPSRTVLRVEEYLRRQGYVGSLDLNSIVDDDGEPYGLEWSARIGFDSTQAWMRLFEGDLGQQLEAFAEGELLAWEPAFEDLSATLRVSLPPYPSEEEAALKPLEGYPLDPLLLEDPEFDPMDVQKGPVCGGVHGIVGTVAARGGSLKSLRADLLFRAGALRIQQKQYRPDPLARANRDMARLEQYGLMEHAWEA